MKRILFLSVLLFAVFAVNVSATEIEITPTAYVEAQFSKEYEGIFFSTDIDMELESQSYMFGANIAIDKLTISPAIGFWNSTISVNDIIEFENELGLAVSLDAKYDIAEITDGLILSITGTYDYRRSEIDNIAYTPMSISMTNPLRNDVSIHSYEIGPRLTYSGLPINIIPYIGVVMSDSNMSINTELPFLDTFDANASENLGIRLGFTGSPIEDLTIGLDVKLLDEESIVGKVAYRF